MKLLHLVANSTSRRKCPQLSIAVCVQLPLNRCIFFFFFCSSSSILPFIHGSIFITSHIQPAAEMHPSIPARREHESSPRENKKKWNEQKNTTPHRDITPDGLMHMCCTALRWWSLVSMSKWVRWRTEGSTDRQAITQRLNCLISLVLNRATPNHSQSKGANESRSLVVQRGKEPRRRVNRNNIV